MASTMIGAGRDRKEDTIDPAVGVILEAKVGQKIDAARCCAVSITRARTVSKTLRSKWKTLSASPPIRLMSGT
jgi:pyrimidine-nucleoside phosphorylase/thymidine phosphorylase